MTHPFIDVSLPGKPYEAEVQAAIQSVLTSGNYIGGPCVAQFESEFAAYIGSTTAVSCASGTDALLLAVRALGIGLGDEVIIPSFTYIATASSVVNAGATPVFCDVDERTFNIDVATATKLITPNTKAIMPVHMFGQCADMDAVMEFAQAHNLRVIEDVAQACGATWRGKKAGSIGDIGCHSFFPTKNLGGYGDGGAITTNSQEIAERIKKLKSQGQVKKYVHTEIGYNSRLDAMQAAILSVKLRYVDAEIAMRQTQAKQYHETLQGVTLPYIDERGTHTYNQFTVLAEDRESFIREQTKHGTPTMVYYPTSLHEQACFSHLPNTTLPISERLTQTCVSLPILP